MIHSIILMLSVALVISLIFVTHKIKVSSTSIRNRILFENDKPSIEKVEGLQVLTDVLSLRLISYFQTKSNLKFAKYYSLEYLTVKKDLERELKEPEIYGFLFSQFESKFKTEFTDPISDPNFSTLIEENLNPFDRDYRVFINTYTEVLAKLKKTNEFIKTINTSRFSFEGMLKLNKKENEQKMDSLIQVYVGIGIIAYFITVISFHRKSKLKINNKFELEDFDIKLLEESSSNYLQID